MGKLGLLLFVASIIFLIASLAAPGIFAPLAPLYCPRGQTLTSDKRYYSYGNSSGYNTYFYCNDGQKQTEVTGQVTLTMIVIFLGLMFGGMGLAGVGITRNRTVQQVMSSTTTSPSTVSAGDFSVTTTPHVNGTIRLNGQEISLDDLKSGAYQHQVTGDNQRTLTDTLSQLEDAHKRGLINDDEYGHLRQDAMNKLV